MIIKQVPLKDIKVNPKNPNKHSKEQIDRLCKIIEANGFRRPLTVSNQSGLLVVGHGRYAAACKLKMETVPVIFQDYANSDLEYADMVADNSLNVWSELDLAMINSEIENLGPDFDIELLGLKDFALDISEKINRGDENSEWVDMPEFNLADREFKIIVYFKSEEDRKNFAEKHNMKADRVQNNQWIIKA